MSFSLLQTPNSTSWIPRIQKIRKFADRIGTFSALLTDVANAKICQQDFCLGV